MKLNKLFFLLLIPIAVLLSSCASIPAEDSGNEGIVPIAFYTVDDGKITENSVEDETYLSLSTSDKRIHEEIWAKALILIPDSYEHYLKAFRISSDGKENILAYVEPTDSEEVTDLSSWTLSVDPLDVIGRMGEMKSTDLNEILIHEFAHILSLNSLEIDPVPDADPEDTSWMKEWDYNTGYRIDEGVAKENSYINRFFQKFWGEEKLKKLLALEEEMETDEEYYAAMDQFSIKYYTDFVSDYAMTNPVEDFSESFTHFVTKEKPDGETISNKKVLFFYDFPELVTMRDEIRQALPQNDS